MKSDTNVLIKYFLESKQKKLIRSNKIKTDTTVYRRIDPQSSYKNNSILCWKVLKRTMKNKIVYQRIHKGACQVNCSIKISCRINHNHVA